MSEPSESPLEHAGQSAYDLLVDFKELLLDAETVIEINELQVLVADLAREFEQLANLAHTRGIQIANR